jgi:hypothetical protein
VRIDYYLSEQYERTVADCMRVRRLAGDSEAFSGEIAVF